MDATAAEYLWSASKSGFLAAAVVILVAAILGWLVGKKWERPRDRQPK